MKTLLAGCVLYALGAWQSAAFNGLDFLGLVVMGAGAFLLLRPSPRKRGRK